MNRIIIFIVVSEDYYGGNVQVFRTIEAAEALEKVVIWSILHPIKAGG